MNLLVNEQLSHRVQQDSHSQQMTDGRKAALQQFFSLLGVKKQGKKVRRLSTLRVCQPAPYSNKNGK
jgi:hypothetical protein